ncbi:PhaM family polyhydroxyalkanoate granule multifunctional regulatory protein [uncultured Methylibium sp.]|uniref:PhaM family polyhydroxyalkanoate granule multifunctional regulatory protein n=1 Tax=uncultured Methylibium sp. TaxID=381093 RepID=UPI0025E101F1|nr:PhaM family polyhydroxyalkanoate granule multifunctional regulatory protein [uncultured Methylibium sp.]
MTASAPDFAKMVPGFDFLQGLVKNAGSVLPNIGQWVAPTLNPEELEKRIEELRTVQFWLEQNARMLGATIQALEVQRMTLSTLKTMNVQVADLRESLRIKMPDEVAAAPAPATPAPAKKQAAARSAKSKAAALPPPGVVDPTQWWGALTKQFTQLAATAMKDAASDSARQLAGNLVKQSFNAAEQTIKVGMAPARKAAEVAGGVVNNVARSAAQAKAARKGTPAKRVTRRR